jgi:hypothetical protein
MAKHDRTRIDYMPGKAALHALELAAKLHPRLRQQALIDKLLITGLSAMRWQLPALYGHDRDRWKLPDEFDR